jgi:hypothetical protein
VTAESALPRLHIVGDARKQPAQFDRGRQLAALLEDGADCSGFCLGDDEHRWSMGRHCVAGNMLTETCQELPHTSCSDALDGAAARVRCCRRRCGACCVSGRGHNPAPLPAGDGGPSVVLGPPSRARRLPIGPHTTTVFEPPRPKVEAVAVVGKPRTETVMDDK